MTTVAERDLGTVVLPVEAGKVVELARAVHATAPAYLDATAARAAGFAGVVAPPTFTVVTAHHEPDGRNANTRAIEAAGVDPAHVLLGGFAWEYGAPLVAGDVLTGHATLAEVTEVAGARAGRMTRIRVVTAFADRDTGTERVRTTATLLHAPALFAAPGEAAAPAAAPDGEPLLTVTRTGIVRYAGASGDLNPVHHDEVYARGLGLPGVFAMGLYPAGVAAVRLDEAAGVGGLAALAFRFERRVWPGDDLVLVRAGGGVAVHGPAGVVLRGTVEARETS